MNLLGNVGIVAKWVIDGFIALILVFLDRESLSQTRMFRSPHLRVQSHLELLGILRVPIQEKGLNKVLRVAKDNLLERASRHGFKLARVQGGVR